MAITASGRAICMPCVAKLLVNEQLRREQHVSDRFFTAHDEFSSDRAENRLLHAALRRVLAQSSTRENQPLARELAFVFGDVPPSHRYRPRTSRYCGAIEA
ncbi:MAG: hypothetical protein IPQ17_05620 [Xanthomonadales bacterium]|nr:hypothetical protein [Xanthomonadales bacterium]